MSEPDAFLRQACAKPPASRLQANPPPCYRGGMDTSPLDMVDRLDPDAIRAQIAELDRQRAALRVLLCAAIARRRRRDGTPEPSVQPDRKEAVHV